MLASQIIIIPHYRTLWQTEPHFIHLSCVWNRLSLFTCVLGFTSLRDPSGLPKVPVEAFLDLDFADAFGTKLLSVCLLESPSRAVSYWCILSAKCQLDYSERQYNAVEDIWTTLYPRRSRWLKETILSIALPGKLINKKARAQYHVVTM